MRLILGKEGDMKRIPKLVAVLGAVVLAACGDDATTSPMTPETHAEAMQPAGARLANIACAQCHGANLLGAVTEAGVAPSLLVVRYYTDAQFEVLMTTGLSREGRPSVPQDLIEKFTLDDRWALRKYLATLREPE